MGTSSSRSLSRTASGLRRRRSPACPSFNTRAAPKARMLTGRSPRRSSNARRSHRSRRSSPLPLVFKRVSLEGSAELFRETSSTPEVLAETDPEPLQAPIHHLPLQRQVHGETLSYYEYRLTEVQVQSLIDAVQKIKYPHNLKNTAKLSMEEFERLEALRQVLIDGLR